ncbi:MAG: hypothetical protein IJ130_13100 [Solobacterium sp.]|nr:hypothetical protein [Erysipelotrichaceae bacterium]MBQ9154732.1 hypothetical protein [Solobacterium sp.]
MSHTDLHIDLTAVSETETEFEFIIGIYEGDEPVREKRMWIDRESALSAAETLEDYLYCAEEHADTDILFAVEEEPDLYGMLMIHIDREYDEHRVTFDSPEYDGTPEMIMLSESGVETLAGWLRDPLGYGSLMADYAQE